MKLLKDLLGLSNAYPEFLGIIAHVILGISSYELLDSSEYIAILYHLYLCYWTVQSILLDSGGYCTGQLHILP